VAGGANMMSYHACEQTQAALQSGTKVGLRDAPAAYRSPVTNLQLFGYGLAFVGVCYYNYKWVLITAGYWLHSSSFRAP
jgi:hypothetical protein